MYCTHPGLPLLLHNCGCCGRRWKAAALQAGKGGKGSGSGSAKAAGGSAGGANSGASKNSLGSAIALALAEEGGFVE
jgi:hypothetical protein